MKAPICFLYLLFFSTAIFAQQPPPVLQWQKCLGGSKSDFAYTVVKGHDGSVIVGGSTDSKDGDLAGVRDGDDIDGWLIKLDIAGNKIWQKVFGSSAGQEEIRTILKDPQGGYIGFGQTWGNWPEAGTHGERDIWVFKFNESGDLLWNKAFGGSRKDFPINIIPAHNGGYFILGNTNSNNGDVSGWHTDPILFEATDIWLMYIDKDGNKKWQKCLGTAGDEKATDIIQTADNRYSIIGKYQASLTNPEVSSLTYTIDSVANIIDSLRVLNGSAGNSLFKIGGTNTIAKVTSASIPCGIISNQGLRIEGTNTSISAIECSTLPSTAYQYIQKDNRPNSVLSFSPDMNFIACSSNDLYPALQYHAGPFIEMDGFFGGFNVENGRFSQRCFGGTEEDNFTSLTRISDDEFIVTGFTESIDGDVSGNHGLFDIWVVKIKIPSGSNIVKGKVFIDNNSNGIKDSNEALYKQAFVKSTKVGGFSISTYTSTGFFNNEIDTGTFNTSAYINKPYYTVTPLNKQSVFSTYGNTDSVDFALQPIAGKKDLQISLVPLTPARPGFNASYKIIYQNLGTEPLAANIKLVKDYRQSHVSSTPAYTSLNADTLLWTLGTLQPGDSSTINMVLKIAAPPVVNVNDILTLTSTINPVNNDETPLNNTSAINQPVTGGFDPNDKVESNMGIFSPQQLTNKEDLLYTIRFQNTGNDTAFNVVVRDTLDSRIDFTTMKMVNASHPFQLSVLNDKYCVWTFNNILLPDSNHNEPLSHGYISYRIQPKAGLVLGDTIQNSASIYFDSNLPVKTNNHITVIKAPLPVQPIVSGLLSGYCSNQGIQKGKLINLPSAGSGILVTVKLNNTVLTVAADSSFSFDVSTIAGGAHIITVSYANTSGTRIFNHSFNNVVAISPDVNVSANITNITNLATPVIVTGTNASGGGTAPLYSFAKDRTFTTILQAEGVSNILNIDPSSLTIGDNWIYIRMKSNATCITSQISIDSIKLVRDMLTGITDPDNPGSVISLYPNPFNKQVFINGLSAGKSYMISITNLNGQLIQQNKISNRTNVELVLKTSKAGTYLLTIYDEKKKLSLGTMKIIRQ